MDETTDREREVANALWQIEKLDVLDLRAVLRHLATDDGAFSEAQCKYMAKVIAGTLHKKDRDAVNANMSCNTGFAAALKWEQNYTSYPHMGHVSNSLRSHADDVANPFKVASQPTKQPCATTSGDQDMRDDDGSVSMVVKDAFNSAIPPNVINRGHLVIHYHYNQPPPDSAPPATVPQKQERDQDDKKYPEAPNPFKTIEQPKTGSMSPTNPFKRARLESLKAEDERKDESKVLAETKLDKSPLAQDTNSRPSEGKVCKNCGVRYTKKQNQRQGHPNGNFPCRVHAGSLVPLPAGTETKANGGKEMFFQVWGCCGRIPTDEGCVFMKHETE